MKKYIYLFFFFTLLTCLPLNVKADEAENYLLEGKKQVALGTERDLLQAINNFKEAIAHNPNLAQAYIEAVEAQNLLASTYQRNRKQNIFGLLSNNIPEQEKIKNLYEEAMKWGQKAMELEPASADAHAVSALIYQNLGNAEEAKKLAEKALILKPDSIRATRVHLLLVPQEKQQRDEKIKKLIELYKAALEKDTHNARLHFELGLQYLAQPEKTLAHQEFEKATQENPKYLYPYLFLADTMPWHTAYTPWKKVNFYKKAISTVTDDPLLAKYYIANTINSFLFSIAFLIMCFFHRTPPAPQRFLFKLGAFVFIFISIPGTLILQYFDLHRFGTLLSLFNWAMPFMCFLLYGLLIVRGFIISSGRSIYRYRFIYRTTESLLEPIGRFLPNSWRQNVAYFLLVAEFIFLSQFFNKLFSSLLTLGQGPWM